MSFQIKFFGVTHTFDSEEQALNKGWQKSISKKGGVTWSPPEMKAKVRLKEDATEADIKSTLKEIIGKDSFDIDNLPKPVTPVSTAPISTVPIDNFVSKSEPIKPARIKAKKNKVKKNKANKLRSQNNSSIKTGKRTVEIKPIYVNPATRKPAGPHPIMTGRRGKKMGSMDRRVAAGFTVFVNDEQTASIIHDPLNQKSLANPIEDELRTFVDKSGRRRVKAGRFVETINRTYTGGQFVPDYMSALDLARSRMSRGMPLADDLVSILEENMSQSQIEQLIRQTKYVNTGGGNAIRLMDRLGIDIEDFDRLSYGQALRISDSERKIAEQRAEQKLLRQQATAEKLRQKNLEKQTFEAEKKSRLSLRRQPMSSDDLQFFKKAETPLVAEIASETPKPSAVTPKVVERPMEIIRKKVTSLRTAEGMLNANVLSAGVVAGAAGAAYLYNKGRGERQLQ